MTPKTTYPSEMRTFTDPLTGRAIRQLTSDPGHDSVHLYFTENSFLRGGSGIIFQSDRDTPGCANAFRMDLPSGQIHRITAFITPGTMYALTKTPDGSKLLFWRERDVVLMDVATGSMQALYTLPEGFARGRLSLSCDGKTVAIQSNEDVRVEHGINYAGFAEKMYRVKRSRILTVPSDGSEEARVVVRDTAEGGHLQFSPVNPHLAMFCHEGPWHIVQQRIYLLDIRTGELWPCFRQEAKDSVGHEFFTRDGLVFFDNRGPGHDGTITSSREQAVAQALAEPSGFIPYVGVADESGAVLRTYPLPYYFNHYHANPEATLLVADGVDDLSLIRLDTPEPELLPLCHHGTSWHGQHTHCHPTFSWDGKQILYASDSSGKVQLYLVEP